MGEAIKQPKSVLFLCGMNSIRSPMAEAIARALLPKDVFVTSAGVRKGDPDPFVAAVLSEEGLQPPMREPHTLDELGDDYVELIITLAPEAYSRALEMTRAQAVDVEHWPTPDPSKATGTRNQILDAYREVRQAIDKRIRERFGV